MMRTCNVLQTGDNDTAVGYCRHDAEHPSIIHLFAFLLIYSSSLKNSNLPCTSTSHRSRFAKVEYSGLCGNALNLEL